MNLKTSFAYGFAAALDPDNPNIPGDAAYQESDVRSAQDEIDRQLALLENPVVGTRVDLGKWAGFWQSDDQGWWHHFVRSDDEYGGSILPPRYILPFLRAAVEGGRARVEIP